MAISLRRMLMRLMGFGIVVVLVLAVSSSSTTSENDESADNNAKANSWIIKGPTRPIRPGFGLPPGGMLLMTMDPNATMPDAMMNGILEASSQAPATEVSITSEDPVVGTETPEDNQGELEVTTTSSDVSETEQPASEEPLSDLVESSSSYPSTHEELVTTQSEDVPTTDVALVEEETESPQQDALVENIQPEVEGPDDLDPTHQDLISTEHPETPQSVETLSTDGPEEPVVATLAQGISGVTTLVPEELPGNDASHEHQDPQIETSQGSNDSEEPQHSADDANADQAVTESPAVTTESDIVEIDLGNGIFADTTLVQVDVSVSDPVAELEGSGLASDSGSGLGEDIHLLSDDGSGSGLQVALDTFDEPAGSGSGDEGSGDVAQDLPVQVVPADDSHLESETPTGDGHADESNSDSGAQSGDSPADDSHSDSEVAADVPAENGEEEHSADLVAHEEPSESQTAEPEQDGAEQEFQTETAFSTDASTDSTSEDPLSETTEVETHTTPVADEGETVRRRRDVQDKKTESKAALEESSSDNQIESKPTDDEARQHHFRPYPIRLGLRRPSYPQRNGPVYNENGVISRTAEFCYTMWCRFKTSLRRLL